VVGDKQVSVMGGRARSASRQEKVGIDLVFSIVL
jgi:hypothetical protein